MEGAVIKKKKKIISRRRREPRHAVRRRRRRLGIKARRIQLIIGFVISVLALIVLLLLLNEVTPILTSEKIIQGNNGQTFSLPELMDRLLQNFRNIFTK